MPSATMSSPATPRASVHGWFLFALFLAALAAAILATPPTMALASERFALTGDDVQVWNLAGETRIEAATGAQVAVLVERGGRDAARLRIATNAIEGHPALCVHYDGRRIVYPAMGRWSNCTVTMHDDGTWGGRQGQWFGSRLTVAGSGTGFEAHADLVVQVPKGRRVSVHTVAGGATITNVDGRLLFDGGSSAVNVGDSRGDLSVDVGSGAVNVHGFTGALNVDTGSGSVGVSDVRGSRCGLDTGSGGVTGRTVVVDELHVDTGSGSVEMSGVAAAHISVDTGSGGVRLQLATRAPELAIDTGSGSVRVEVPDDFSATVYIETGSGGIRSDVPLVVEAKESDLLRGRIGDGAGRLHVDTGSGGVTIARAMMAKAR